MEKIIILGGKEYKIPELPFRQQRIIFPLMATIPGELKEAEYNPLKIKGSTMDDILQVVTTGIQKAQPEVSKDYLIDSKMTVLELMQALPVIATQAGLQLSSGEASGEKQASPTSTT